MGGEGGRPDDVAELTAYAARLAVLAEENTQLREALRRIRHMNDATPEELNPPGGFEPYDTCGECCAVEIAAATLAELDPLAPDPEPVADLLAASSLGDPASQRIAARAPATLAVAVASRPDACPHCGDAGLLPGDEWCDCPAGRYWTEPAPADDERAVVTLALPPTPEEGTR